MLIDTIKQIKYQLLSSPSRSVLILLLSLIAAVFEAIGITTLVPIFEIINSGEVEDLAKYEFVSYFLEMVGASLTITSILVLFFMFITLKALFGLIAMSYIGGVVAQLSFSMRKRFVTGLLQSKWPSITKKNSGEFLNAVNFEVPKAASIYRISCTILASLFEVILLFFVLFSFSIEVATGGVILGFILFISLGFFIKLASEQSKLQVNIMNSMIFKI